MNPFPKKPRRIWIPLEQSGLGALGTSPPHPPCPLGQPQSPQTPQIWGVVLLKAWKKREEPWQGVRSGTRTAWPRNGTAKVRTTKPQECFRKAATIWIFFGDSPIFWAEIPADLQGLPRWELQSHRKHLMMELLWIQQAIASRKQVRAAPASAKHPWDGLHSLIQGFGWL